MKNIIIFVISIIFLTSCSSSLVKVNPGFAIIEQDLESANRYSDGKVGIKFTLPKPLLRDDTVNIYGSFDSWAGAENEYYAIEYQDTLVCVKSDYLKNITTENSSVGNYRDWKTGKRGGQYYINSKGKKTYKKKK